MTNLENIKKYPFQLNNKELKSWQIKSPISLKEYNQLQIQIALNDENIKKILKQKLKRTPTEEEIVSYWASHGGSEEFRKKYGKFLTGRQNKDKI